MKEPFKHLVLAMALASGFSGDGASVLAAEAAATASATVVAPGQIGNLPETFATNTLVSSVSGDLTIHIPGRSRITIPSDQLNSVPLELFSMPESVCTNGGTAAGCVVPEGEPGSMQGDPVQDVLINMLIQSTLGEGSVAFSLNYN